MFRKSRIFVSALIVIAMLVSCCIPAAAATVETVGTRAVPSPTFLEVTAPSIHMTVGDTAQLTYAILPANISVSLSWYSSKTSVATVSSSGLVTAVGTGTVTITLTAASTSPLGGSISDTVTLYVHDDIGIKSNIAYYIMNAESGRFLSLETTSDENKANVYTRPRSNTTMSQWTPIKYSNSNEYKLVSKYSATDKCLDVTEGNVDIYTDNGGAYLRFTIDRIESGTYQGLYLIRYDDKYYVTQDTDYNVYITTTLSEASYWSFMAVEKRYADYFGFKYPIIEDGVYKTFNSYLNAEKFELEFGNIGYSTLSYMNGNATTAFTSCLSLRDDIFIFVGHGAPARIGFCDSDGNIEGGIIANSGMPVNLGEDRKYINNIADNGLARARIILYLGCETGVSHTAQTGLAYNLIDETYEKGARFVLGLTEVMYNTTLNDWLECFMDAIYTRQNIDGAIDFANDVMGTIVYPEYDAQGNKIDTEIEGLPIYSRGDSLQYLNIY